MKFIGTNIAVAAFGSTGFVIAARPDETRGSVSIAVRAGAGAVPEVVRLTVPRRPAFPDLAMDRMATVLGVAAGILENERPGGRAPVGGLRRMAGTGFESSRPKAALDGAEGQALAAVRSSAPLPAMASVSLRDPAFFVRFAERMFGAPAAEFEKALQDEKAFAVFRKAEALDLDAAKQALRACPDATARAISWYGASPSEEIGVYRRQAAESYPLFASEIAADREISRAVDERRGVGAMLTERFGLTAGALKRLGKVTIPGERGLLDEDGGPLRGQDALGIDRIRTRSVSGKFSMRDACAVLSKLPPDWTPSSNEEWKAFTTIGSVCLPVMQAYNVDPKDLFGTSKGKWENYLSTLARASGFNPANAGEAGAPVFDRRALALCVADAVEMVHCFSMQAIGAPAARDVATSGRRLPEPSPQAVGRIHAHGVDAVVGASGLVGLLETSRRWISRIGALAALPGAHAAVAPVDRYGAEDCPPAFAPFTASNGLVLRCLTTGGRLREETRRLGHCVGQLYIQKNAKGDCHIVGVGDRDDQTSYSTVEFEPFASGRSPVVIQHQGNVANGRAVPPDAAAAFAEFRLALDAGRIAIDYDSIRQHRELRSGRVEERRHGPIDSWSAVAGYDANNASAIRMAAEEWRGVVGQKSFDRAFSAIRLASDDIAPALDDERRFVMA